MKTPITSHDICLHLFAFVCDSSCASLASTETCQCAGFKMAIQCSVASRRPQRCWCWPRRTRPAFTTRGTSPSYASNADGESKHLPATPIIVNVGKKEMSFLSECSDCFRKQNELSMASNIKQWKGTFSIFSSSFPAHFHPTATANTTLKNAGK